VFDNPDGVAAIFGIGGIVYLAALLAGFVRTVVRLRIPAADWPEGHRPQLLVRDVLVIGGFAVSSTAVVLIRFLPLSERLALTQGNVLWALLTTIPSCVAVLTYVWFELFVIGKRP
jgi:hypothetical protein